MSIYTLDYLCEALNHRDIINPETGETIYTNGTWDVGVSPTLSVTIGRYNDRQRPIEVTWLDIENLSHDHTTGRGHCCIAGCSETQSGRNLIHIEIKEDTAIHLCHKHFGYFRNWKNTLVRCKFCERYLLCKNVPSGSEFAICASCKQAHERHCARCGETCYADFNCNNLEGQDICLSCYRQYARYCCICSDSFFVENLVDGHYCHNCESHGVFHCSDCNNYQPSRYESRERGVCKNCYSQRYRIREYSYKPTPRFLGRPTNKRYYGIELEVDNGDESCNDTAREILQGHPECYCKDDGSLHNGFEIVTHPASLDFHLNNMGWDNICAIAKNNGFKSHDAGTCGLHIHVSKDSLTMGTWAKIVLFWYTQPEFITMFCRRTPGNYCRNKVVNPDNPQEGQLVKNAYGRYDAVNLESNAHTVEFRQFKGTLNSDTIKATLLFLDSLFNFLQKKTLKAIGSAPKKILEAYLTNLSKHAEYALLRDYIDVRKHVTHWQER